MRRIPRFNAQGTRLTTRFLDRRTGTIRNSCNRDMPALARPDSVGRPRNAEQTENCARQMGPDHHVVVIRARVNGSNRLGGWWPAATVYLAAKKKLYPAWGNSPVRRSPSMMTDAAVKWLCRERLEQPSIHSRPGLPSALRNGERLRLLPYIRPFSAAD